MCRVCRAMGRSHAASSSELRVFIDVFRESLAQEQRRQAVAVMLQCASRAFLARESSPPPAPLGRRRRLGRVEPFRMSAAAAR